MEEGDEEHEVDDQQEEEPLVALCQYSGLTDDQISSFNCKLGTVEYDVFEIEKLYPKAIVAVGCGVFQALNLPSKFKISTWSLMNFLQGKPLCACVSSNPAFS